MAESLRSLLHLLRFLGVNIGLVLQPLNLCSDCRVGDEARFTGLPGEVAFEEFVSVLDALDSLPATCSAAALITDFESRVQVSQWQVHSCPSYIVKCVPYVRKPDRTTNILLECCAIIAFHVHHETVDVANV